MVAELLAFQVFLDQHLKYKKTGCLENNDHQTTGDILVGDLGKVISLCCCTSPYFKQRGKHLADWICLS